MKEGIIKRAVKFFHFSVVGMTFFAVQLFITVLLTEGFGVRYYISYAVALVIAWFMNFIFNMKLTFEARGHMRKRLCKFAVVATSVTVLNWLLVLFLVEALWINYIVSIILVTGILAIGSFLSHEAWVFRKDSLEDICLPIAKKKYAKKK